MGAKNTFVLITDPCFKKHGSVQFVKKTSVNIFNHYKNSQLNNLLFLNFLRNYFDGVVPLVNQVKFIMCKLVKILYAVSNTPNDQIKYLIFL